MPFVPAISSHSLGRAFVHDLVSKLDQAAKFGLDIELFFEDLEYLAYSLPKISKPDRYLEAARMVRSLCDERGISIVCLQPFMHYEGLRDREHHVQRVADMEHWIQLARVLRTSIISIPSTFLPEQDVSGDINLIVEDLREVADLAASHNIKLAFEALAWGTYINTWEQAWTVVEKVNRWNFGICLDTFNMAAKMFADPESASRKTPDAEHAVHTSLQKLRTIDPAKIFYVQVVDAEYLREPLVEGHKYFDQYQHPRMSWSRHCRLFYGEYSFGAYLPIKKILQVILNDLGFDGWLSAELFNVSLTKSDASVPGDHAERAKRSFQKVTEDCKIDVGPSEQAIRAPRIAATVGSRAQL